MSQPIVLVIFHSRSGSTEKLALAAAVGAVQARALIRLRRLPDAVAEQTADETLSRMLREYVAPAEADLLRADAIILAVPPGFSSEMVTRLRSGEGLRGAIIELELSTVESAMEAGRKAADAGRALKETF